VLWWLAPRATFVEMPGGGLLASEASWVGILNEMKRREQGGDLEAGGGSGGGATPRAAPQPAPAPRPADWLPAPSQFIVVVGIAALIALLLVYFQVREFRRRRPRTMTASKG